MRTKGNRVIAAPVLLVVLLAAFLIGQSTHQEEPIGAATVKWDKEHLQLLNTCYPNNGAVARFLEATFAEDVVEPAVAEFVFVDLGGDGNVELLVTIGGNWINELWLVKQTALGYQKQEIDAYSIEDLQGHVIKLDSSEAREVVVPQKLEANKFGSVVAVFQHVYKWNGESLIAADAQYKSYYRGVVLPELQRQQEELASETDPLLQQEQAQKMQAVKEEYIRYSTVHCK